MPSRRIWFAAVALALGLSAGCCKLWEKHCGCSNPTPSCCAPVQQNPCCCPPGTAPVQPVPVAPRPAYSAPNGCVPCQ
jgi:hypothetical protein